MNNPIRPCSSFTHKPAAFPLPLGKILLCVILSTCAATVARAQTVSETGAISDTSARPDYSAHTASYHIPFTRPVNFQKLTSLHVRASLNGGPPTSFLVDTGSVGVIVSADEVPNIDPKAPAGSIKYSSSGIELDGVWTTVTLTFPDSLDAQGHVATAVIPVLAVRKEKVSGTGVNAAGTKPSTHPKPHMFGIGFGRGLEAHPERNPFINLNEMQAGTMRRGYTITRDGYTLGLTAATVPSACTFQKLTERAVSPETSAMKPGLRDWETAPGSVTVGTTVSPMGTVLMDTGLSNMMIAIPGQPSGADIAPGTHVTMHLLGGQLNYSFDVGDTTNPLTPRRVTWVTPTHGAYVNTGLCALAAFDYLFDADGGYIGLRPVNR